MLGKSGVLHVECCREVLGKSGVEQCWGRVVQSRILFVMVDCYDSCCDFGL